MTPESSSYTLGQVKRKTKQESAKMHIDLSPILLGKSLLTGFIAGSVFAFLKLPIPAPSEFASIVGIIGVFLGLVAVKFFLHM